MRLNEQRFEMVRLDGDVDRLKEHPRNPKRGNLAAIEESVDENGWFGAVLAQESTGYILAGNHKYRTAVRKGAEAVPVLWIDVDDERALRILLADNKIAELGEYDEEALQAALDELPDLDGTGFGLALVEEMIENGSADAAPAALPTPNEVPPDSYESQYGVLVVCESAEHQREVYEYLQGTQEWELKVVAI